MMLCGIYHYSSMTANAASCLNLQSDLSSGMTDLSSNGPIFLLQKYLSSSGYLSASANGHFGPASLSAVKAFQAAHSIPATGYVGTMTRTAIDRATCGESTAPPAAETQVQTVPAQVNTTNSASTVPTVIAPTTGQTLSIGQAFNIQWSSQPYSRYDVILVSPSGAGAGYIASSLTGASTYLWTVGNVFSSQSGMNQTVSPGSYQIRIENSATGAEPTDPISQPFMIVNSPLNIASVFPASAPADGTTAVVLYGSGFTSLSSVGFTASGARSQPLYTSPDGRVLVFAVPVGTTGGSQEVYVTNNSNQTSSNQVSFTPVNP